MSYLDYKWKIEFDRSDYDEIDDYCAKKKIKWFASVWDDDSVDFMRKYTDTVKIPSALLTHHSLGEYAREKNNFLMLSTGMSNESDIDAAIASYSPDLLFHTNSTYPCPIDELNLGYIKTLLKKHPSKIIGYSGHEFGLVATFTAVAFGAKICRKTYYIGENYVGLRSNGFCRAWRFDKISKRYSRYGESNWI